MENYNLIKVLNAGSFGTAYLAEKKEGGRQVVVKEKRSDILF